jgi:hypothetical protein
MALESTQLLKEMMVRNLPGGGGGKGGPGRMADKFTPFRVLIAKKIGEPRRLRNLRTPTTWYRETFTFLYMKAAWCTFELTSVNYPAF